MGSRGKWGGIFRSRNGERPVGRVWKRRKGEKGKRKRRQGVGLLELSRRRASIKTLSITARGGIGQVDAAVQPLQGVRAHEGVVH